MKSCIRTAAVKIAKTLKQMECHGLGYYQQMEVHGAYRAERVCDFYGLYYIGCCKFFDKLDYVLDVPKCQKTFIESGDVWRDTIEYEKIIHNSCVDFLSNQNLFTFSAEKQADFDTQSESINEFLVDLMEEYISVYPNSTIEHWLESKEDFESDLELEEDIWIEVIEMFSGYIDILNKNAYSKESRCLLTKKDRDLLNGFANLISVYFFQNHTSGELLANPDFVCSVMSCYKELLFSPDDGFGNRLGYCKLKVYQSKKIYQYVMQEDYHMKLNEQEREAVEQCIEALQYIQNEPNIGGLLISKKDKTAYLYITEDSFFFEKEYGMETLFRKAVAAIKVLEVLLKRV